MKGLFITGTDTDVGKTYVTSLLARELVALGYAISARKPIASGCVNGCADAQQLAAATGEDEMHVCPYRFPLAVSPERAMRYANKPVTLTDCVTACKNKNTFTLVEGAGGWLSPLAIDGNNADLAARLNLPIMLVVANRLGCINHALLTLASIQQYRLDCCAIVLNNVNNASADPDNITDLQRLTQLPVFSLESNEAQLSAALMQRLLTFVK